MPVTTPTAAAIAEAGSLIRAGALVAFPTETVYGLGADATNPNAVAAIFTAKGRPSFNPLIVHVADLAAAEALAELPPLAIELARQFWPGPLTLVANRRADARIAPAVTAGLGTIAVRVPGNDVALALLAAAGVPVAAPSANRSGHVSPTRAEHVAADLADRVAMILDGGASERGLESTVLDVSEEPWRLLRHGSIPAEAIEQVLGHQLVHATHAGPDHGSAPASPGQLLNHYAPRARVRLDIASPETGEGLIAFGPQVPPHDGPCINLSPSGDLAEAAARLYAALRELDAAGVASIAVVPIPKTGLGAAISDRLSRAAAGRPPGSGG